MSFNLDLSMHMGLSLHATLLLPHHSMGSSDSPESSCSGPELGAGEFILLIRVAQRKRSG